MKCTREIKKETFDIEKLDKAIQCAKNRVPDYLGAIHLVMSHRTKGALRAEAVCIVAQFRGRDLAHRELYRGHPIDINDSLDFGEVQVTIEVGV